MPSATRRFLFISVLMLAILACNLPIAPAPAENVGEAFTAAAQTVAVAVNQTLVSGPSPSAFTPEPGQIFTPLPSLTATLSPTPNITATSSTPLISVTVDTNCRVGPGKVYDYLGGLLVGQTAEVFGKNPSGNYYYIRLPENPGIFCWVTGQYATVVGDVSALPVYTPQPTPTPLPSFEFSYAGMDKCSRWWAKLQIKNLGLIAFRSFSLTVKDLDLGISFSSSADSFTNVNGCIASETIVSIEPGQTYIISGPEFNYNFNNHRMRATLTLCSMSGLAGSCVKDTIDFKP